jgi:hypothetical protein
MATDIWEPPDEYQGAKPMVTEPKVCERCEGCGKIADSDDGEPWTFWANLPPGSDAAVKLGLVNPIPCPDCGPHD